MEGFEPPQLKSKFSILPLDDILKNSRLIKNKATFQNTKR